MIFLDGGFRAWGYALGRVVGVSAIGLVVGWAIGHAWWGLAGALAIAAGLLWHNLYRLEDWLRHRNVQSPPDTGGLWGEVISQVSRLHRRKQFHKQRMLALFRELRRSSASMPDGVVVLTSGHEILWFNRKAGELLGLRRKTDFGIPMASLLRFPEFARYLARRDFSSALRLQPRIGEAFWLEFQGMPYGEGQLVLLVRDVTRQAQLETMRKDFVANASHELRSPLTVIAGYLETLSTEPDLPADLRPPVLEMRRQSERMTAIITDLLELSRLEASDEQVAGAEIDITALLELVARDLRTRDGQRHPIEVRIESGDRLRGDAGLLHSAFWNLADNASKYTPAGGRITLRWWVDDDGGHFAVIDTGPGIPAEHLPRLTERFYRVDPGRARDAGGSGLGLAIVRHVMQRHGGELAIASVEGEGSTFTCHLPAARLVPPAVAMPGESGYAPTDRA